MYFILYINGPTLIQSILMKILMTENASVIVSFH